MGNRINYLYGILNGTCNYILTRMEKEGSDFQGVLEDAQRLGYAEAEPSLDVDGFDAMHKAGLLGSLAHGFWIPPDQIHVEGIRKITPLDYSPTNWATPSSCWRRFVRPPKKECKFLYAPRSSLCSTFWREFEMFSMPSTLVVMWLGKPSIMVEERGRMLPPSAVVMILPMPHWIYSRLTAVACLLLSLTSRMDRSSPGWRRLLLST